MENPLQSFPELRKKLIYISRLSTWNKGHLREENG